MKLYDKKTPFPKNPLMSSKIRIAGKPIQKGLFSDTDGDGYNDPIDCEPLNPKKQGMREFVSSVGSSVRESVAARTGGEQQKEGFGTRVWKKYKEANTPEAKARRHEQRMERLEQKAQVEVGRTAIQKVRQERMESKIGLQKKRIGLQKERTTLQGQRQTLAERRMSSMPSLGSFGQTVTSPGSTKTVSHPSIFQPMPTGFGFGGSTPQQVEAPKKKRRKKKTKTKRRKSKKKK